MPALLTSPAASAHWASSFSSASAAALSSTPPVLPASLASSTSTALAAMYSSSAWVVSWTSRVSAVMYFSS